MKKILFIIIFISELAQSAPNKDNVEAYIKSLGGIENALKAFERKISKTLPRIVDSETEIFSVISFPRSIRFNNRLYNYEKSDISDINSLRSTAFNKNAKFLCSSPVSKVFIKDKNVKYTYTFYFKE